MNDLHLPLLLCVMGPTGSGKSDLAEAMADTLHAQLLNSDAFQVYRRLNVGTCKSARKSEYALMDIKEPTESYGLGEFVAGAVEVAHASFSSSRHVVMVGGTGLYSRALAEGYADLAPPPDPALRARLAERDLGELKRELEQKDPDLARRTDLNNPVRVRRALERLECGRVEPLPALPACRIVKLALDVDANILAKIVESRTGRMMQNGWTAEVEGLRDAGVTRDAPAMRAIGYRTVWDLIEGRTTRDEAMSLIVKQTTAYAKRQRTWLRSEPRLHWLTRSSTPHRVEDAMKLIELN